MTNLLLAGVIICQLLPLVFVLILIKRLASWLSKNARSFFEPNAAGSQSPFADTVDQIAARFGAAITASLKGFLMAENSAVVRQGKAVARQEIMASNPMLSGLAAFAPGLINKFAKNPEALQAVMSLFNRGGGTAPEEVPAGNNGSSSNPFKI